MIHKSNWHGSLVGLWFWVLGFRAGSLAGNMSWTICNYLKDPYRPNISVLTSAQIMFIR